MPCIHDDITLGMRLRTQRVGNLAVHEVRYAGGWSVPVHAHARANLTFMLRGAMEETAQGESRLLRSCDAIVKPVGTPHSNRCGPDGARTLVIELHDDSLLPPQCALRGCAGYGALRGPEIARAALRARYLLHTPSRAAIEELHEIVIEALALLPLRPVATRSQAPWLATVRGLLHEGFATPLRLRELARAVDLHPVYLARAFRADCGCSITAYRRRLQVGDAARRLAGTNEPLASVALRSGFADQSHLCRAFRSAVGLSPGAFRRHMRGE